MRVPGVIYASDALMELVRSDRASQQVANVAHLPGIRRASFAMPDIHWGYGFPIGGVAATDVDDGGVISPGGVGFDICCGVRLLASNLEESDFERHRDRIMANLGGGNNDLEIDNGVVQRGLSYQGRSGNDRLEIGADATLGRLAANLGGGSNHLQIAGNINGAVIANAFGGNDTVQVGPEAQIDVSLSGWHIQALKAAYAAGAENRGLKTAIDSAMRGAMVSSARVMRSAESVTLPPGGVNLIALEMKL